MTKRVELWSPEIRLNETNCRLLCVVAHRAENEGGLRLSPVIAGIGDLANAMGVGVSTVRASIHRLCSAGFMTVEERSDENGGRLASSYELTAIGLEAVRIVEERGLFDRDECGDE